MNELKLRRKLAKFKSFQYFMCIRRNNEILRYVNKKSNNWLQALKNTKPVLFSYRKQYPKVNQYMTALSKLNIVFDSSDYFIHSIDESLILFQEDWVIDNMPLDYQRFVDSSINELISRNEQVGNDIARQNIETLKFLKQYFERMRLEIEKSDFSEKEKTIHFDIIDGIINSPAKNLRDALQRILYLNQLLWQFGHRLNGIGRLDKTLDRFDEPEDALAMICDFIKVLTYHYEFKSSALLGDIGQIIILAGNEVDSGYFCNKYTYIITKAIEKMHVPDPKILLRVSSRTPDRLWDAAIDCLMNKSGSPLFSNDDTVIPAIIEFGYEIEDAHNYCASACWEPLIVGKSLEQNNLCNIEFAKALENTQNNPRFLLCKSFEEVEQIYFEELKKDILDKISYADGIMWAQSPIMTLFTDSCVDKNLDISVGGAKYCNYGFLSVGMGTAVEGLLNIRELVFEHQLITLEKLHGVLKDDYQGNEEIRNILLNSNNNYCKDDKSIIACTQKLIDESKKIIQQYTNRFGGKIKFGLSSPQYIDCGKMTGSTADGRRCGSPFMTHISSNSDLVPTEICQFVGHLNLNGYASNGNVADIMLPSTMEDDKDKIKALVTGAINSNIYQMQFNMLSYEQLVDAKRHPQNYKSLIVRVWGFSSYFIDLPEEYQDRLIERARRSASCEFD